MIRAHWLRWRPRSHAELAPISWTGSLRGVLPLPFERQRTEIAECRVPPRGVVEELDVLEHRAVRVRPRPPSPVVGELDLERREEALGDRVVPAAAGPAHAAFHAMPGQDRAIFGTGILRASIRMMQQPRRGAGPRH